MLRRSGTDLAVASRGRIGRPVGVGRGRFVQRRHRDGCATVWAARRGPERWLRLREVRFVRAGDRLSRRDCAWRGWCPMRGAVVDVRRPRASAGVCECVFAATRRERRSVWFGGLQVQRRTAGLRCPATWARRAMGAAACGGGTGRHVAARGDGLPAGAAAAARDWASGGGPAAATRSLAVMPAARSHVWHVAESPPRACGGRRAPSPRVRADMRSSFQRTRSRRCGVCVQPFRLRARALCPAVTPSVRAPGEPGASCVGAEPRTRGGRR